MTVLAEIEVVNCPMDRGLDVGDEGVDPAERLPFAGLALAIDDCPVLGDLGSGGGKAGRSVGDQVCRLG